MRGIEKVITKNLINFTSDNNDNDDDISFNRELLQNNINLLLKNVSLIIKVIKMKSFQIFILV